VLDVTAVLPATTQASSNEKYAGVSRNAKDTYSEAEVAVKLVVKKVYAFRTTPFPPPASLVVSRSKIQPVGASPGFIPVHAGPAMALGIRKEAAAIMAAACSLKSMYPPVRRS
jgi:hypothetical protein